MTALMLYAAVACATLLAGVLALARTTLANGLPERLALGAVLALGWPLVLPVLAFGLAAVHRRSTPAARAAPAPAPPAVAMSPDSTTV